MNDSIYIFDKDCHLNKWVIEHEEDTYYEVSSNGYTTVIPKEKCATCSDGRLISFVTVNNSYPESQCIEFNNEECCKCGRRLTNTSYIYITLITDKYICKCCKNKHGIKAVKVGD